MDADCLSCWDIHLSWKKRETILTRYIQMRQQSLLFFHHIWCLTQSIKILSPNWNSTTVRVIPPFMFRVIALEYAVLEIWNDLIKTMIIDLLFYFSPLGAHALGQAVPGPSLCTPPPLRSQTRCTRLRWGSFAFQVEQNNKIPSISISDRPIHIIGLPWLKFVSTRASSSADVISTKYPPFSIQN